MLSPSQAARVAAEDRHQEQREQRAMDSKTIPKFSTSLFNKGARAGSVTSAGSDHKQQLSPALFFEAAVAKEAAEIGEAVGTGDYPGFDTVWYHWTVSTHPNAAKLSDFEKSNVEELCITSRHQRAAGQTLEELLEQLQEVASDEDKGADAKAAASSIITAPAPLRRYRAYQKHARRYGAEMEAHA